MANLVPEVVCKIVIYKDGGIACEDSAGNLWERDKWPLLTENRHVPKKVDTFIVMESNPICVIHGDRLICF